MAQARRNRKSKTPAWVWLVIGILLGFFFSHIDFLQAYKLLETSIENSHTFQQFQKNDTNKQAQKRETKFDFYNILSERNADHEKRLESDFSKEKKNQGSQKYSEELETIPERKRIQNEVSDLDAVTQKRSMTQLPLLSKQKKFELSNENRSSQASKTEKLELPALSKLTTSVEKNINGLEDKLKKSEKLTLQIAALRRYSEADQLKAQLLMLGFQGVHIQKISKGQEIWFRVTVGNNLSRQEAESIQKKLQKNNVRSLVVPSN